MTVGQSSLYIWKAIVPQATNIYYLYHQNNGRVNNIFVYNTGDNGDPQQQGIQACIIVG